MFKIFLSLYNLLPFIFLTLANILLITTVVRSKRQTKTNRNGKHTRMVVTIVTISTLFMAFTLPTASIQGSTLVYLLSFDWGQIIISVCNVFAFTFQASNIIMLSLTNRQFFKELKQVLRSLKKSGS